MRLHYRSVLGAICGAAAGYVLSVVVGCSHPSSAPPAAGATPSWELRLVELARAFLCTAPPAELEAPIDAGP